LNFAAQIAILVDANLIISFYKCQLIVKKKSQYNCKLCVPPTQKKLFFLSAFMLFLIKMMRLSVLMRFQELTMPEFQ
jgi:hypothetical protein